jgi:hypothetical protein
LFLNKARSDKANLPVLIPLGAGRKRAGVSQDVAPALDEFRMV